MRRRKPGDTATEAETAASAIRGGLTRGGRGRPGRHDVLSVARLHLAREIYNAAEQERPITITVARAIAHLLTGTSRAGPLDRPQAFMRLPGDALRLARLDGRSRASEHPSSEVYGAAAIFLDGPITAQSGTLDHDRKAAPKNLSARLGHGQNRHGQKYLTTISEWRADPEYQAAYAWYAMHWQAMAMSGRRERQRSPFV